MEAGEITTLIHSDSNHFTSLFDLQEVVKENVASGHDIFFLNLFLQATKNYEKAVQLNWNSPQV